MDSRVGDILHKMKHFFCVTVKMILPVLAVYQNTVCRDPIQKYHKACSRVFSQLCRHTGAVSNILELNIRHRAFLQAAAIHAYVDGSSRIKMDMDADELLSRYIAKNKENFDRQNGLSAKAGYQSPEVNA